MPNQELPPYYLLRPDGTGLADPVIAQGSSGVVVQRDGNAIKLPLLYCILEGGEPDRESLENDSLKSQEYIKHEKSVFERLEQCDGIVRCLDLTGPGIRMELMENGNLGKYLRRNSPSTSLLLSWARQMARGLVMIHKHRVILAEVAIKDFLVDNDLSLKFTGFAESIIFSLDTDMNTAAHDGYSVRTDIGQIGAILYEIIAGRRSRFNLSLSKRQDLELTNAALPPRESLPSTKNIMLGEFIDKCWTEGAFDNEYEFLTSLDSAILQHSVESDKEIYSILGHHRNIATPDQLPCSSSLDTVLLQQEKPDWVQRLTWIKEAAGAIAYAHSKNVILANVAASNFVVDSHGSLRLYNFSDARIVPQNSSAAAFDENGISIKNDVVRYGLLVYHITTGRRPEFPINKRGDRLGSPLRKRLQNDLSSSGWLRSDHCPAGVDQLICDVIWSCWSRDRCRNMKGVCSAVSRFGKPYLFLNSIKVGFSGC